MKTKPNGIFEIFDDSITVSDLEKTLARLLNHIDEGRAGIKEGVWTSDEILGSIWCYISIMKGELIIFSHKDREVENGN